MEPGQLLFSLLSQAPAVVALVGYGPAEARKFRIYPLRIEATQVLPAITYQVVGNTNEGNSVCELEDSSRVQINIFTKTYTEGAALTKAVRAALAGQRVGDYSIEYAGYQDHHDDAALCYFRSIDFIVE